MATPLQSFPRSPTPQPPRPTLAHLARHEGLHLKPSSDPLTASCDQVCLLHLFRCLYDSDSFLHVSSSVLGPHPPSPSMPRSPGYGRRRKDGPPLVMMFPCVPCGRDVELGEKGLTDCLRNLTLERIVERCVTHKHKIMKEAAHTEVIEH